MGAGAHPQQTADNVQLQLVAIEILQQGWFYLQRSKMVWSLPQERGFVTFWDAEAPGQCEELGLTGGKKKILVK